MTKLVDGHAEQLRHGNDGIDRRRFAVCLVAADCRSLFVQLARQIALRPAALFAQLVNISADIPMCHCSLPPTLAL